MFVKSYQIHISIPVKLQARRILMISSKLLNTLCASHVSESKVTGRKISNRKLYCL